MVTLANDDTVNSFDMWWHWSYFVRWQHWRDLSQAEISMVTSAGNIIDDYSSWWWHQWLLCQVMVSMITLEGDGIIDKFGGQKCWWWLRWAAASIDNGSGGRRRGWLFWRSVTLMLVQQVMLLMIALTGEGIHDSFDRWWHQWLLWPTMTSMIALSCGGGDDSFGRWWCWW